MNFDIRWEDQCRAELLKIYGANETADVAAFSVDWRLARNPLMNTWPLDSGSPPTSGIRLVRVESFRDYPTVFLSFRIVIEGPDRYCLMLRARRANDPLTS
jgi:hypothetical protein